MSGVLPQRIATFTNMSDMGKIDFIYENWQKIGIIKKRVPVVTSIRDSIIDVTDELIRNTPAEDVDKVEYRLLRFREVEQ